MTHHDKARELVERLKQWDGCWPASVLERDVLAAADLITAQAERIAALEGILRDIEDWHGMDCITDADLIARARAALSSTGEKG